MATELEKLKELEGLLHAELQEADAKTIAPIAKQYRETVERIAVIEGMEQTDDEIDSILTERERDGKPGAIRQDRTGV